MLRMNQINEIKELQRQGLGPQEIAGRLNLDRKTVAKYMKVEDFNGTLLGKKASVSKLDPWKSKFTEEQIAFALRQAEAGTRVAEVCRKMGISEQTYFRWKKRYGGLGIPELRRLRQLEEENRQLKRLVADLTLDKQMLQDVLSK